MVTVCHGAVCVGLKCTHGETEVKQKTTLLLGVRREKQKALQLEERNEDLKNSRTKTSSRGKAPRRGIRDQKAPRRVVTAGARGVVPFRGSREETHNINTKEQVQPNLYMVSAGMISYRVHLPSHEEFLAAC